MSEEVPEQKSNKSLLDRIPLSETLMLATVPILAYVVVFVFEIGHLSFFQLPAAFVVFDFTNIFLVAASLLLVGVVIYYYGDTFYEAIKISPDPIRRRLRKVFPSIVIFLAFFFIYSEFWREWIFALIAVLVLTLPSFITPLITQRKTKGYLAKLEAEDKINDNKAKAKKKDEWETPYVKLLRLLGPQTLLFLVGLYITYNIGRATAFTQKDFYVVNTLPERAVLWMTSDYAVCAPLDRTSKEVEPSFIVLKMGEYQDIEFSKQRIGPLKLRLIPSSLTVSPTPTVLPTPTVALSSTISAKSTVIPKSSQLPTVTQWLIPTSTITPTLAPLPLPTPNISEVKPSN